MDRVPVIVDTDIGTDVDDIVALGVLLRAPTIDLRAITTVYVNAALRARIVKTILAVAGRPALPVGCGADKPLLNRDPLFWEGWEGEGLLRTEDADAAPLPHAIDLLTEMVLAHPGELTILAIGPLTNIALALAREPRMAAAVRRIVIMGGMFQRRFDQLSSPYVEHNIRCDPEAAQIVLASGAPITLVPLDVTTQVRLRRDDLRGLRAGGDLAALIADQLERYMGHKGRDWTNPHDPLTAAAVAQPDLLRTFPLRVNVETHGEYTRAQTVAVHQRVAERGAPAIDVALEVDVARSERWLIETLAGSVATAPPAAR